ncbi:MAG: Gfo/Idh/MocA family protein [Acidobacteriota bacterium]
MKNNTHQNQKMDRRAFIGSAAAGVTLLNSRLVRGSRANSALRMGILGCGGRGTAVGSGFVRNTNTRVLALADLFPDQLEKGKAHFDQLQKKKGYPASETSRMFLGPRAYQEIAHSGEVDFILITTPPYFHPHHLRTVVAAGKHVYCEKPVAVDVAGAAEVVEVGKLAEGKVSLDVGFQIRNAPPFVELTRRIQQGAVGEIACVQAYYYSGALKRPEWPAASPQEARLRNWVWDRVLSGDIIVEQNIHVIDVCNWVLQGHPLKASGSGGRKVADNTGNCYDHFNLTLTYETGIDVTFSSTQFNKGWWDVCERFFGSKGVSEAHYSQPVAILGDEPWDYFKELAAEQGKGSEFSAAGSFGGALKNADPEKQKAFVESITSGHFHNQAAQGAESALSAMLGREAAYSGKTVGWDELLNSNARWEAGLDLEALS